VTGAPGTGPIIVGLITINVMIAMIGTATIPLMTGPDQQLDGINRHESHSKADDRRSQDNRVKADSLRELGFQSRRPPEDFRTA
jgi:hypothetical protein